MINKLLIVIILLAPLFCPMAMDLEINKKHYSCIETHRIRSSSAEIGLSVMIYYFCASEDGERVLYSKSSNGSFTKAVIFNESGVNIQSFPAYEFYNRADMDIDLSYSLIDFLTDNNTKSETISITNDNQYVNASRLALKELESARSRVKVKEVNKQSIPDKIYLNGIVKDEEVTCSRGVDKQPKNKSEWFGAIANNYFCQLYFCSFDNKKFLARFNTDDSTVVIDSIYGNQLGPTFYSSLTKTIKNEFISNNEKPVNVFSPENVATYGSIAVNQLYRRRYYSACVGNEILSFEKAHDQAIKIKRDEITNIELVELINNSFGQLVKTLAPKSDCLKSISPVSHSPVFTQKPMDRNYLTLKDAESEFAKFKKRSDLPIYIPNGCEARAHVIADDLDKNGYFVEKVFLQANSMMPKIDTNNSWDMHVAPLVPIKMDNGDIERMVFDVALFDQPVTLETWLNKIRLPEKQKLFWTDEILPDRRSLTEFHRAAVTVTPWNVYEPGVKPAETESEKDDLLKKAKKTNKDISDKLNKIMQTYLQE